MGAIGRNRVELWVYGSVSALTFTMTTFAASQKPSLPGYSLRVSSPTMVSPATRLQMGISAHCGRRTGS